MNAHRENFLHISPEYRKEQERLHETTAYGTASIAYAPIVSQIVNRMGVTHLLDYGCGAMVNLSKHLKSDHKLSYQAFDPGVPRFAKEPLPAEMVACIDVLEHVEPDFLDAVLDDLKRLTEGILFVSFDTGPAVKVLSDGRNAHLIQQPLEWWLPHLWSRFDIQTVQSNGAQGYFVIAYSKPRIEAANGDPL